ncbi:MAG: aminopeptidase, partial [Clostridia bacterium]|nr:aminopeptidase [Clostridia bacterium]
MKKTMLRKYARLIAEVGANVQKDQPVLIYVNVDQYAFATLVAEECYKLGAKYVRLEWSHDPLIKMAFKYQSLETLKNVPKWQIEKMKLMAEEFPCRIHIASDDPDGLKGIDIAKMQASRIASYKKTKKYRDAIESKHQWTIAAVPSAAWAKKVYPTLSKSQAIEKLWQTILDCVRVTEDNDPV